MSPFLLGILAASGSSAAQTYFLASLDTGADYLWDLGIDSESNIYTVGYADLGTGNSQDGLIVKYTPTGSVEWQRILVGSGAEQFRNIKVGLNGDVYVGGYTSTASQGGNDLLLVKYNSSGTVQWQKSKGGTSNESIFGMALDSADNVYLAGRTDTETIGGTDSLIIKYNSSGTLQWQRALGGNESELLNSVAVDYNDDVYVCGYSSSGGQGSNDFFLAKYNSSGTIQWQRFLGSSVSEVLLDLAIDINNNIYITGFTSTGSQGSNDFFLAKYNSSGTLQWQNLLGGINNDVSYGIDVDSESNIYITGYTNSVNGPVYYGFIAKYNSSGVLQWQRVIGGNKNDFFYSIKIDSNDDIYISGRTQSVVDNEYVGFIGKLPSDGSLQGAYRINNKDISYAQSSFVAATATLVGVTSSLTSEVKSFTSTDSNLTNTTTNFTSYLTEGNAYAEFVSNSDLTAATENEPYSEVILVSVESLNTTKEFELISGSLPAGISFDASTAVLSGTSTEAPGNISTFTIRVTTSSGLVREKQFNIGTVMQPKISGADVVNVSPYTDQYYVVKQTTDLTVLENLSNVSMVLVGGGASGSRVQGTTSGLGGVGGSVNYVTAVSLSGQSYSVTIGSGGSYTFSNSNPGSPTSGFGYTASGGSGTTSSSINGSTAGSSIMIPVHSFIYTEDNLNQYDGMDQGYLGGSGSRGTSSTTPVPPGLGGGGTGICEGINGSRGLSNSGGGGGAGGTASTNGSVGQNGGSGLIVLKVPNQ